MKHSIFQAIFELKIVIEEHVHFPNPAEMNEVLILCVPYHFHLG